MTLKKKSLMMLGLVLVLLLAGLGSVVGLSRHVPEFYKSAAVPPGKERHDLAFTAGVHAVNLYESFDSVDPPPVTFTAKEINSFLQEAFLRKDADSQENGISDPRVSLEADRIRLGFRYRNYFMTTIVSLEMRVWLVQTEMNTFALEILNRRAGALPFPTQALLEEISKMARSRKIEVNWYRHNGHPVALVRIHQDTLRKLLPGKNEDANSPRPTAKFQRLELKSGELTLVVGSGDPATPNQAQNRPLRALPPGVDPSPLRTLASPTPNQE